MSLEKQSAKGYVVMIRILAIITACFFTLSANSASLIVFEGQLIGAIGVNVDGTLYNVSFEDIRRVYLPAMRHRVILNFEAQAEGLDTDHVLLEILEKLPEKSDDMPVTASVVS